MEETVEEILFETRRHASGSYSSNYPPQKQVNESRGGRLISYVSLRVQEKWSRYKKVRRPRKSASIFVSSRGDFVAVASGNQITILQKDNDYQGPIGTFACGNAGSITCGAWSESRELLGVADDTDTIYIVKPNGEEMTRITKRHLNISLPIIGLIVLDDGAEKNSCSFSFTVFVSDGSLHHIEISKDPNASVSSVQALDIGSMQRRVEVCCWDYHPELSLFTLISGAGDPQSASDGSSGSFSLSVWRRKSNLQLDRVVLTKFEGAYFMPPGNGVHPTSPKVLFSPGGNYVATIDMKGCLYIFQFDEQLSYISKLTDSKSSDSKSILHSSSTETEFLHDIVDFTWWSHDVLIVAKRNGTVTYVGILVRANTFGSTPTFSTPILERAVQFPGLIFILDSTLPEKTYSSSEEEVFGAFERSMKWSLATLLKKSALEIYDNLIAGRKYQAAFDFAEHHGFDQDEVLKSQWLSSVQGVDEIKTILANIKDKGFVLSECVDKVGPTEDAVQVLLSFGLRLTDAYRFSESEDNEDGQIWDFRLTRLKLLRFKDRLETFIGINMGRFSVQEYRRFRNLPISKAALALAESGKIGALNLLFKRHPCSLIPSMLEVLAAIPETIPIQTYEQLLPAVSAPSGIVLRDEDWVECKRMLLFIRNSCGDRESSIEFMTEPFIMKHMDFKWPSSSELSSWYWKRATDIDSFTGQLDNSMYLIDWAVRKGISELKEFYEDIFFLHQLIYPDVNEDEINLSMSLAAWKQLPDYEKFKLIMMDVKDDNVIPRLQKIAVPFMQKRLHASSSSDEMASAYPRIDKNIDSFLVRWMKEIASQNRLDLCLIIIDEGCRNMGNQFFKNESEVVDCALQCIYLCTDVDSWSTMSTILYKLQQSREAEAEDIKQRLNLAEGHVEAGRLLSHYQVPKPISFILDAHTDEKGVKHIIRLFLSKFIRCKPSRTDHDWANMWRDLQSLREKAFPFLDLEFLLVEFCRGLLKAGKFSLARNYLKGNSSITLATNKAENLVIQAAREYFYSAPSLACPEIWKAKECLDIFPSSRIVRAEADIIDAVTVRLPNLGVSLLPMEFRQIKEPMEIVKLAITSQSGAYLNVDEIIDIAKLLGLSSQEDIATVQEAVAREAAFAGDVQLAFDICLVLAKKGHGAVWDLCAALARSQALESMDSKSQKLLLGFALTHCDDESMVDLLHEWKDLDIQDHCVTLSILTGRELPGLSEQFSGSADLSIEDHESQITKAKALLSRTVQNLPSENDYDWETLLQENSKVFSFAASQLPWLLELSEDLEVGKRRVDSVSSVQPFSVRIRALMTALAWLTQNGFCPRDEMIASLARSIMEPPVSDEEDLLGCSVLLNLADAFHGAEIIEEQLKMREDYREFSSLMNAGMIYSLLHSHDIEYGNPSQRRELLQTKFQEKHKILSSEEYNKVHESQSSFWNDWKFKLEQQKHVADKSRVLEKLIPGVQTSRFISKDMEYIETVVYSLIESVKRDKKQILKDVLTLAQTYGLDRSQVLLHYLSAVLVSEAWSIKDIMDEVPKEEILACAQEAIKCLTTSVYPAIDGHDKQRLAFFYNLLSECYMQLDESKESSHLVDELPPEKSTTRLARFCKLVGSECNRVSFIRDLDFKNIAGLQDLNFDHFNSEVCAHIDETSVEALAKMVQNLALVNGGMPPEGLLPFKYVYTHYVLDSLVILEGKAERETNFQSSEELFSFITEIEQMYDTCKKYIRLMEQRGLGDILNRFFTIILPLNRSLRNVHFDSTGKECILKFIKVWLRLMSDIEELVPLHTSEERFSSKCSVTCLQSLLDLLLKGTLSPNQVWCTLVKYVDCGMKYDRITETLNFTRAMIFTGCGFEAIAYVFFQVTSLFTAESESTEDTSQSSVDIHDIQNLYLSILEPILQEIAHGLPQHQSLHYLLFSLSKLEGNLDDLNEVRLSVWNRMSKFSNNLALSNETRVYILELMQFISGELRILEKFSEEQAHLLPWEGWKYAHDETANHDDSSNDSVTKPASSNFTNTLVALKSSQLVMSISPSLEITPEDILTLDSATSCFGRVSEIANSASHIDALIALLAEWEGLFVTNKEDSGDAKAELPHATNNWNSDDWDDGWESFQEESDEKETNNNITTLSVHPLHICWVVILRKLVAFSRSDDILKLLDSNSLSNHRVLMDEDDTRALIEDADCLLALKVALLLPYEAIQLQCLDAFENKLKEGGVPDDIAHDHLIFILVLSSGMLSTIVTKDSYGTTFSYICFLVGNFCRRFQASVSENVGSDENRQNMDLLFAKILFPCFVAELVKAHQHVLAGFMVTKYMHTNVSIGLVNIAEASLRRFLEMQLQGVEERGSWDMTRFCETLLNALISLRDDKLADLIQSAVSLLPNAVR